jgi:hypothetical protein
MPDGRKPEPGGWNRIIINVGIFRRLRNGQLHFRNDIVSGPGGSEMLLDDPSGNPVELFQPAGQSCLVDEVAELTEISNRRNRHPTWLSKSAQSFRVGCTGMESVPSFSSIGETHSANIHHRSVAPS